MHLIFTILPSTGTTERERVVVGVAVIDRVVQQLKRGCKRNTYKKEKKRHQEMKMMMMRRAIAKREKRAPEMGVIIGNSLPL